MRLFHTVSEGVFSEVRGGLLLVASGAAWAVPGRALGEGGPGVPLRKRPARTGRRRTRVGSGWQRGGGAAGGTDRLEGTLSQHEPGVPQPGRTPGPDERGGPPRWTGACGTARRRAGPGTRSGTTPRGCASGLRPLLAQPPGRVVLGTTRRRGFRRSYSASCVDPAGKGCRRLLLLRASCLPLAGSTATKTGDTH
jgi:hypothetical protein